MRLAVDTNVLVSAAIADGPPRRVLELITDGQAHLVLPAHALDELTRVFIEKLRHPRVETADLVALLTSLALVVAETPDEVPAISGDPDDDKILAAAVAAGADVLVSGDRRHVLPLGQIGQMRILRAQDLLAEISS